MFPGVPDVFALYTKPPRRGSAPAFEDVANVMRVVGGRGDDRKGEGGERLVKHKIQIAGHVLCGMVCECSSHQGS